MNYYLALAAVIGCAVCNGTAVILEKIGVDEQPRQSSFNSAFIVKLVNNAPYMAGIALDIIGWLLTLVAVRALPLFLVQSVVSANIVIAALLDELILRRRLPRRAYGLILMILAGLSVLASTAAPTQVNQPIAEWYQWGALGVLLILGLIGSVLVKLKARVAAIGLAVIAGIAFGSVSIVGRLLIVNVPFWHFLENPLSWVLIAYSGLGMLFFSIALQRTSATTVNAVAVALQTVAPAAMGIALLGDGVRDGYWPLMLAAMATTLIGAVALASLRSTVAAKVRATK